MFVELACNSKGDLFYVKGQYLNLNVDGNFNADICVGCKDGVGGGGGGGGVGRC